ncbi:MAG: TonB-dependent receptor [Prevotellaceae bacterium]|jgi:TonB-linked SusC/RagA family outer membrane protein|nr:TonB-dependent receptor [Prevotellaceae bacterium]
MKTQETTQQSQTKGRVVDERGEPIIGANASVKGTANGTITDLNGQFTLTCSKSDIIVITYIGFSPLEIRADQITGNIVLREDTELLDEVVVIGYGTTTRKSAVGAVDQVRREMLENRPVPNATLALQGVAPNVIIQRRNLDPNSETNNFNIRGINTTTDNNPLFVIDGLVTDATAFNRLNPNDIDNISILKDAGTAAIYGSRAAGGVVLVTTKSGKKNQETRVTLNGMLGWNVTNYLFQAVPGYQNAILTNMQYTNVGQAPSISQDQILDYYNHLSEENWAYNQIYKNTLQQNYNVNISGGSDKTTYMIAAGYFDVGNNYNVKNQQLGVQRYNFRTNVSTEIGRLKLTAIMDYTRYNSKSTAAGNIDIDASRVPAWYTEKIIADDGRYLLTPTLGEYNTLGELNKGSYNKYRNNYLTTNVSAEFKIIDGLKLRGVFGANIVNETRATRNRPQTYYRSEADTEPVPLRMSDNRTENWNSNYYRTNSQLMADYVKSFGLHNVNGMIGFTNESYTSSSNSITKLYVDDLGMPSSTTTGTVGNISGGTFIENNSRTSINSVIGRFGYNWHERYYGEFTFRYDASSKFHEDYRWGFFPSVSAGWRTTEEPWMASYKEKVGDLKLRASWGILGNQAVGNYDRFTVYNMSANGYVFNNQVVSSAGFSLGKNDLTWEKTQTFNIGVDASFIKNTFNLTFDYFYQRTTDILQNPQVPSVFGTSMPRSNMGEMSNRGWELALNYRLHSGKFNHTFSFNIADSRNKMDKYPGHERVSVGSESGTLIREGQPYNVWYGWATDGLFQSYDEIANSALPSGAVSAAVSGNKADISPGDWKFTDQNKDGVIDAKDYVILGDPFPHFTYGFTYNLEWNGFDFSVFAQGVGERTMFLRGEMVEPFHAGYSLTIYKHQLDFWTPTNTGARWPRLAVQGTNADQNNWGRPGDYFMLNAAYLRIKNMVIGYTLPRQWTKAIGIGKMRVYVNAQDLFTFTENDFIDPESSDRNINMSTSGGSSSGRQYQPSRYYGFGFDIEF